MRATGIVGQARCDNGARTDRFGRVCEGCKLAKSGLKNGKWGDAQRTGQECRAAQSCTKCTVEVVDGKWWLRRYVFFFA